MKRKEKYAMIQRIKDFFEKRMRPPVSTWFYEKLKTRMNEEIEKVKNK